MVSYQQIDVSPNSVRFPYYLCEQNRMLIFVYCRRSSAKSARFSFKALLYTWEFKHMKSIEMNFSDSARASSHANNESNKG